MRLNTLAKTGAALTASALVITLSSGPANAADDSASTGYAPASAPTAAVSADGFLPGTGAKSAAGNKAAAGVTINKIGVRSGVLYRKGDNSVFLSALDGDPGGAAAKTEFTLRVGKKDHKVLLRGTNDGYAYFNTKSGWGSGKAWIRSTTVTYTNGTKSTSGTDSNKFYLRRATRTTANKPFKVTAYSPGTKIKFRASTFKVFKPSSGKYTSLGSIRLQYKKSNGKWKTVKKIKLNKKGSGSWTTRARTRTYRLYVPTTANVIGGQTGSIRG
ncbi:hypothetical protein GEV29_05330 [Aeromicrobium sp. SMF47]|uniref:hypothetical protein n=1 Tax=Aeromicrobium yanjiei TaxID=2662028 RepID=UPI00129D25CC|nr:hypothetical protein [Aeromicrobium yanjiei]MRJ75950.1 hypothetical protein [Aeromicrobium yanjiei]